jgi:hypothetical protein
MHAAHWVEQVLARLAREGGEAVTDLGDPK